MKQIKKPFKLDESHNQEHASWSRRNFLQTLGIAGGVGIGLGGFGIDAFAGIPSLINGTQINDRILILIRLKGGNDGLNMIVPTYDFGTYRTMRPTIAIAQNDLIPLDANGAFAMPKTMNNLLPLWNNGNMKIINSVGYPDHSLSHFTSTDIWSSTNKNIETSSDKSGWLGRYLLQSNPNYINNLPAIPGAIKVNSGSNITFQSPDRIDLAVNFNTPDKLIEIAERGIIFDTENLPDDCYYGEQVGFLRSILNITYKYAPNISKAFKSSQNSVAYSNNELSRQLAIVARLIKGNLGTRLYMVTLDGFDTHENQNNNHPKLMQQLSSAISEFYSDLNNSGLNDKVLSMTFSEFGRRVKENDGGTDHGTAAPVMLFGSALEGNAIFGKDPDLKNTDVNGNLKIGTDFRSIYATILESWLCVDSANVDAILGQYYDRIPALGFDCSGINSVQEQLLQKIQHKARCQQDGSYLIEFTLSRPAPTKVEIFTILGHNIATITDAYLNEGHHESLFVNRQLGLSAAIYIYKITSGNSIVSGKFVIVN